MACVRVCNSGSPWRCCSLVSTTRSDRTFQLVPPMLVRLLTTICAQWYLGSANGNGTRPGVGAALFVLSIPLFAIRLFAPPTSTMLGIMTAVTAVLVVGYSWQDTHLPTVGNPGVGYNVAWRVRPAFSPRRERRADAISFYSVLCSSSSAQ